MRQVEFKSKPFIINNWTILKLPKSASIKLPSRGQVMVKGTMNGQPLQTALEPDGDGSHWFRIDRHVQKAAGIIVGDVATLTIEPTKDWPEPDIPADIQAALHAHPRAQVVWNDVTPMARWEWIRWINSTKEPATRARRIEVSCSKLMAGTRRPCCFNRNMCCVPEVSKNGVLLARPSLKDQ